MISVVGGVGVCVCVWIYVFVLFGFWLVCCVAFVFDSLGRSALRRRCYLRVVELFVSTCCMHAFLPAVRFALPVCLPACFIQSVWRCISCIEL